jgi:hypothetical protein
MSTITPGAIIRGFEVLSVDPSGKRVCVACPCGGVHVVGTDALRGGVAVCAAVPLTPRQIAQQRGEAERQQRQHELRRWRPGA